MAQSMLIQIARGNFRDALPDPRRARGGGPPGSVTRSSQLDKSENEMYVGNLLRKVGPSR